MVVQVGEEDGRLFLLTAYHNVADGFNLRVVNHKGAMAQAKVVCSAPIWDLALLTVMEEQDDESSRPQGFASRSTSTSSSFWDGLKVSHLIPGRTLW